MELFGWEFKRKQEQDEIPSFTPKENEDGAVVVAAGGSFGTYVDLDGTVRTEAELVGRYREMALQPECDSAVDEIVNEAISVDDDQVVDINLDALDLSDKVKKIIREEFQTCLTLLNFDTHAYEIFRRWYIDGRLYFHVMIDDQNTKDGIKEIRYIDPRKIRKVKEITKKRARGADTSQSVIEKTQNEYYIFNDKGFNYGNKSYGASTAAASSGLRIAKDAILHITSGLTDTNATMVLSYLHKAIKSLNQLRTLEDALVVYRLARAPERRIWYIDVGNLPKMKAEQYVRDIMVKHKNRLIYDAQTGEVRDDRKFMTMLEDYWLPRREGGRGTEVTTLPGGQSLGQMDDVLYFQKKFYQTLNVPVNRLNSDALFSLGRATEVTRDEIKFAKFITRLRARFSQIFLKMLEKQLVLKQIMSIEDFALIQNKFKFEFAQDSYFAELKDGEMVSNRVNLARNMQDMIGKYYSNEWVRKNILRQSDDDIEQMDEQIGEEQTDSRFMSQDMMQNQQMIDSPPDGATNQEAAPAEDAAITPQSDEKSAKVQNAQAVYDLLKRKTNRSLKDEADFKSASQTLARNK